LVLDYRKKPGSFAYQMKTFRCKATNIPEPIFARVVAYETTTQPGISSVILNDASNRTYEITVSGPDCVQPLEDKQPYLQFYNSELPFDVGDIVLIEPSGSGSVVFQNSSRMNSVLLTERCNSHCIMCPQPPKSTDASDTLDIAVKIISMLDEETNVIGITGGEPTLEWNGLERVLRVCSERIPGTSIQLLTNARILRDFDKASELASWSSGNLFACIPLYSDVATIHDGLVGAKGAFWDTLDGIYNLERLNIPIELRIVVTSYNYTRLPEWAEFVYRNMPFLKHIAIMGLEPVGLAAKNINKLYQQPNTYTILLEKALKILRRRDMPASIFNHPLCHLPQSLRSYCKKSISEWKIYYPKVCDLCNIRQSCGGLFESSRSYKNLIKVSPVS
jgi:His-Xaa-Ser system radical SAM maturase HxsC